MAHNEILTKNDHSCNDCGKSFYCESKLKIHHRIHTGSKPFKCITFKKTFYQAHSLKRTHEKKITQEIKPINLSHVRRHSLMQVL